MDLLSTNYCCLRIKSRNPHFLAASQFLGVDREICGYSSSTKFSTKLCCGHGGRVKALAGQNQTKRSRKRGKFQKTDKDLPQRVQIQDEYDGVDTTLISGVDYVEDGDKLPSSGTSDVQSTSVIVPSRTAVLQACTVTCGLIGAVGVLIRQVSHFAAREGWPVLDCSADITCKILRLSLKPFEQVVCEGFTHKRSCLILNNVSFELWHLELIAGSVILVSSCRFLLLKTWPDFAESSQAANQQVLTSLEPLDYLLVAFLPGISEELLFRGALLPLFGVNSMSIFAVAALFGVLHLGSGRKYSFAVWATFVGLVYGYATTLSSSIVVPMASHALNNLVAGVIWRYSSNSSK